MEILIAFLNLGALFTVIWLIWKYDRSVIRRFYWPAMFIKLLGGIALGLIYSTYYSSSDTFSFFESAVEISERARTDFSWYINYLVEQVDGNFLGESRTLFFVKLVSIGALLTFDNYWVTSLYFSLISFLAAWWLANTVSRHFPDFSMASVIAFLFFPSCVFWGAGIMKESVAIAGLFCVSVVFLSVWVENKISIKEIVVLVLAVWIVWNLKYYYVALFVPVLSAAWFARKTSALWDLKSMRLEGTMWIGSLAVILFLAGLIHPNLSFNRILDVVIENNTSFLQASSPGDAILYNNLEATWFSTLINSPLALVSGLYRPFLWESNSLFKIIASIENVFLFVFTLLAIPSLFKLKNSTHRLLVVSIISYCVLLCIFLALSAPNFGTLVRYRIGFLPFLVVLIINRPFLKRTFAKIL